MNFGFTVSGEPVSGELTDIASEKIFFIVLQFTPLQVNFHIPKPLQTKDVSSSER